MTFSLNMMGSAPKEQEERIMRELNELLAKYGKDTVHYAGWNGTFTGQHDLREKGEA